MSQAESKPAAFWPYMIEGIGCLLVAGAAAYGVYTFQQQKISRLEVENRRLRQEIASLQSASTQQKGTIARLTQENSDLKTSLQTVCRESQAGFFNRLEYQIDRLLEKDVLAQWRQICQNVQARANLQS
ncbi:hypothetical protein [Leptolyngbya sp. 7M]|uniref:hypothetical protein n=1 Tax=Leptolyngbya sp. 7M TaxID=2812896 RepID=UPI001B8B5ACB|nr:hypothetical protein [Leptolyngbya sp. 7M]QYO63092.1 hypothetical protein JVX88_24440 [Leptolyngbya sp. 7M]